MPTDSGTNDILSLGFMHYTTVVSPEMSDEPCFGTFESPMGYGNEDVCFQILRTPSGGKYPYLDCWHFSAPGKSAKENIFNPAIEALKDNGIIK